MYMPNTESAAQEGCCGGVQGGSYDHPLVGAHILMHIVNCRTVAAVVVRVPIEQCNAMYHQIAIYQFIAFARI